jgi:hypothetical protein
VDYLRAVAQPVEAWFAVGSGRRECAWAEGLAGLPGAAIPVPRFGASDCHCPAHLIHFVQRPDPAAFMRAVGEDGMRMAEACNDQLHHLGEFADSVERGDDARSEEAALAVGRLGDAALPVLRDWLAGDNADRRWWACRALAAVGTLVARELLVAALEDPDPAVRACAAQGLGELRAEEAVAGLVLRLADSSPLVSRVAADGLARIGAPAVPALIAVLQAGEAQARAGAARALSIIRPQEAVPALCAALDDPSAIVTYYADEALERMGVGFVFFHP